MVTCLKCENENLNDYPVCTACAVKAHFPNRWDCKCETCALLPELSIQLVPRGTYDFTPPFKHEGFLADFEKRIGKRFRFWNVPKACWQITPADPEMIGFIASILHTYFPYFRIRIYHIAYPAHVQHVALAA